MLTFDSNRPQNTERDKYVDVSGDLLIAIARKINQTEDPETLRILLQEARDLEAKLMAKSCQSKCEVATFLAELIISKLDVFNETSAQERKTQRVRRVMRPYYMMACVLSIGAVIYFIRK